MEWHWASRIVASGLGETGVKFGRIAVEVFAKKRRMRWSSVCSGVPQYSHVARKVSSAGARFEIFVRSVPILNLFHI